MKILNDKEFEKKLSDINTLLFLIEIAESIEIKKNLVVLEFNKETGLVSAKLDISDWEILDSRLKRALDRKITLQNQIQRQYK